MRRSTDRIITTHVGSLPGHGDEILSATENSLRKAITDIVSKQRSLGIDIGNDGEFAKGGDWINSVDGRLQGFAPDAPPKVPLSAVGLDREVFSDFYSHAARHGGLYFESIGQARQRNYWICTGPVHYCGHEAVSKQIALLADAIGAAPRSDYFITTTAPGSLEPHYAFGYYKTTEEFLFALADAMRIEYELITGAGFLLQIDDAWLAALWERIGMAMGLDNFKKHCMLRVEALNHALRNIPEDKVRYHHCWGSWHGPHAYDLGLRDFVDVLIRIKAQGYSVEGANPRHEHEYRVWKDVKIPENKIIIPGVIAHSTNTIEHPEVVSERIQRYAAIVGRERVIASADCGFGGRTHPQIAWAKFAALKEGAELATKALWP